MPLPHREQSLPKEPLAPLGRKLTGKPTRTCDLLCKIVNKHREKHAQGATAKGHMKEDLLDIRAGIKAGRYVNEATVSQGIVQRLFHTLGWPVYDTEVVAPEYSLGGRRVDYALCHPPRSSGSP